jgi:hypothetical protein
MIPTEVAAIATLIWPDWADLEEDDCQEVIAAAWRIHKAGYRVAAAPAELSKEK